MWKLCISILIMVFSILSILFKGYSTGLSISIALLALIMLLLIISPRHDEFEETTRQNIRDKLEKLNDQERALIFSALFILRNHIWRNDIGVLKFQLSTIPNEFKSVINSLRQREDHLGMILDWGSYVPGGNTEKLVTELINQLPFLKYVYYYSA